MQDHTAEQSKRVALHTLGCRLNFSETGSIGQGFVDRGYQLVEFGEPADVVFINTCTVTDQADSTCRNLIRKAHRSSPEGKIVVAGCYAQMEAAAVSQMTGVDLVLGTSEKYKVFDYLQEEEGDKVKIDQVNEFWGAATSPADSHTRAFLKIQDGCNYICSFCIIPFARGRSRALAIKDAIGEANDLRDKGFKEIVLTGVNIGEYESNTGERLSELLKQMAAIDGIERIRLSSVEPNTLTDDLLEVMASSKKFQPHFHIPLQSGSDEILKKMKRKYDTRFYRDVMNKIKAASPSAGVGADIIVGFPGETDAQFEETYNFVREMPLTHFHVFPYSRRKNTMAAKMSDHIQKFVKKTRVNQLIALGNAKLQTFAEKQVGTVAEVLFETKRNNDNVSGYTANFLKVEAPSKLNLQNQIGKVKILHAECGELKAELL